MIKVLVWLRRRLTTACRWPLRRLLRLLRFRTFRWTFKDHVVAYEPDIIHAHELLALPAAAAAAKATGARLVYDSHELELHRNPPLSRFEKWQVRRVESRGISNCDAVISVGDEISDYIADCFEITRPTTITNSPVTDINGYVAASPNADAARRRVYDGRVLRDEINPAPGHLVCVYVGTVTINRGLEVVLEALAHSPGVHLVTIGRRNEKIWTELMNFAERLGVTHRIEALEPVDPIRVVDFIKDGDFGVLSVLPETLSYDWSMPNKLFELTLAGLPILCSNTESASKFVGEHGLGLVYQAYDPMDCAHKLRRLISNLPSYRVDDATLDGLRELHGWEAQEKKLLELYTRL